MCGRFVSVSPFYLVAEAFGLAGGPQDLRPSFNISPGQFISAVVREGGRNRLARFRWGLIPSWAKDPAIGNRLINARAESLAEKPAFRDALRSRRCLVIADGFYEWRKSGRERIPHYVRLRAGGPFGLAGLFETWVSPAGESLQTCTIITTQPNELLKPVHDRMPAIIPKDRETLWLDPALRDARRLLSLLQPYPPGEMEIHQVSRLVNSPGNDAPDLIAPVVPAT